MATRSVGTKLKIGKTSPVTIGGLTSINGLSLSAETLDSTALDSEGGYREFETGFKDGGEVSVSGYFDFTTGNGHKELFDAFENGNVDDYTIEFPPKLNAKWEFKGVVTAIETSAELDGLISFSATIKVSGKPSLLPMNTTEGN